MVEESHAMEVRLTEPRLVERRPDKQSEPVGRYLTIWRGEFEGSPDDWWREAFAMWARGDLQGICAFKITAGGYEFECGEDQIDEITEKLIAAAKKAGPTAERSRAKDTDHQDTRILFKKIEAAKRELLTKADEAERRELQERMARKFKSLEE